MGALTSNRKRGDDYFNTITPQFDHGLGHIAKKTKLSAPLDGKEAEFSLPISSKSIISRIARYPDAKPRFSREVHAPVRNTLPWFSVNSRNLDKGANFKDRLACKVGNFLGTIESRYEKAKYSALSSLRYYRKENDVVFEKEKEKEVIEIDDNEEKNKEDVLDDSTEEDLEMLDSLEKEAMEKLLEIKNKMVEKGFHSNNSSAVSDVSNADMKVDGDKKMTDLVSLDQEPDGSSEQIPIHKKLYDSAKKRNDRISSIQFEIEISEKLIQRLQLFRPQKKEEEEIKKGLSEECFVPLTEEEELAVANALSNSNRRKILVTHQGSNIDITGEILQCLRPRAWLNDEVINLYMELLKEREKRQPEKFLKCHFFNTFFYKKLIGGGRGGYNYQSVRRWTTQRKIGYSLWECDKIFVPVHKEIHWCLAVINKKEEKFQYLDSLKGVDTQVMKVLARYYVDEVKDKSGKDIDVGSWEHEFVEDLPEQLNGFDCGVFMIKYADFYSRDIGLCFSQEHMPYFRQRTAKEILNLRAD